jgi:hypothetical protein
MSLSIVPSRWTRQDLNLDVKDTGYTDLRYKTFLIQNKGEQQGAHGAPLG